MVEKRDIGARHELLRNQRERRDMVTETGTFSIEHVDTLNFA
jgi:hypothetical protein